MQQNEIDIALITQSAPIETPIHGGRAKCLQRLVRLDLPVPRTVALSFEIVHKILLASPRVFSTSLLAV